jgi:hypothetical protein
VDSFQANSHLGSEQCVLNGLGVMPIDFRHMPPNARHFSARDSIVVTQLTAPST